MFKKSKVRLETYRQNIEGELAAMIFSLAVVSIVTIGGMWACIFILRHWLLK